jgi:hypothetical protein
MRRTALVVAVSVLLACAMAWSAAADVKIYMTVGSYGGFGADQIWRCDRDGSNPELLYESTQMGGIVIDPAEETVFYSEFGFMYAADLDCSNPVFVGLGQDGIYMDNSGAHGATAAAGGYLCFLFWDHMWVYSCRYDGSDGIDFNVMGWPGLVPSPYVVGLALYVTDASPVGQSTWGRIKSEFK